MRTAAVGVTTALIAAPVAAQPRADAHTETTIRLELAQTPETAQCLNEAALRSAVTRRLGRDPFDNASSQRALLTFGSNGAGLALSIDLLGSDGVVLGRRTIRTHTRDCAELTESAAVALLVALDVFEANASQRAQVAPTAAPSPAVQLPPGNTVQTVAPSRELVREQVRLREQSTTTLGTAPRSITARQSAQKAITGFIGLSVASSLGDLPLVAGGAAMRLGIRWRSLGVFGEGRAMLPTVMDGPQASRIESTLFTGSVLPCFHREWLLACGVASFGALFARGSNVDRPQERTIPVISVGARAGGNFRVPGEFFVDVSVEVLGALLRPALTINAERVWDAPPLQGSLRAGVGVELR